MLHQVVAIGDIHLQSTHPRNGARLAAVDQIIEEGVRLPGLIAWVQLGDVFHGRSTPADRNAIAERLVTMAWHAPVVIVRGNHDAPGDLDIFRRLDTNYDIVVATEPGEVTLQNTPTGAFLQLALLPYPQRAGLVAAGVTADATQEAGRRALEDIVRGFAANFETQRQAGSRFQLFAAHVNVLGSVTSNGQPVVGQEVSLDRGALDRLGPTVPKVLGHIHTPQRIGDARYAGSICRMDFGEVEEKRYLVVEWDDEGASYRSCPIAVAPMFHVEGVLSREGLTLAEDASDEVRTRFERREWAGCEVRLRYSFPASERAVLEQAAVDMVGLFEGAAHLQLEPVAIPDRALRAPEVASAKTLREKVDAWARVNGGRAVPATMCDKLARLEHDEPTQLLSAVANQVAAIETPAPREEVTL